MKIVGQRMRELRESIGLSQVKIGKCFGVGQASIWRYEMGESSPPDVRRKSHCKMLIDTFVNAIYLFDDKMAITFNYKDGTKTITFDDLKTALSKENMGSDLDYSGAPNEPLFS